MLEPKLAVRAGLAGVLLSVATGCTPGREARLSRPIPLEVALGTLENQVRETNPVSASDLSLNRTTFIAQAITTAQCAAKSANPVIPVVSGAFSIALTGSFQQQGGASGGYNAGPTAVLSYQITQGEQQAVTVPVTFVSVEGLPNFLLGQAQANLSNLDKGSPTRVKAEKTISADYEEISDLVATKIANFEIAKCPPTQTGAGPVAPPIVPQDVYRRPAEVP